MPFVDLKAARCTFPAATLLLLADQAPAILHNTINIMSAKLASYCCWWTQQLVNHINLMPASIVSNHTQTWQDCAISKVSQRSSGPELHAQSLLSSCTCLH